MKKIIKNNASLGLTVLGTIGFIATIALTIKASDKTKNEIDMAEFDKLLGDEETDELTVKEKAKIIIPNYILPVGTAIGTLACFWSATVLSKKQQTSIIGANALMQNGFKKYRNKLIELYGEKVDREIIEALAREDCNFHQWNLESPDQKLLWYEPISGQWFEKYEREVMDAEYHFNRNFTMRGEASFNEFLEFLGISMIEEDIGWSMKYGYFWVDFEHAFKEEDGRQFVKINYVFGPEDDYGDDW